MKPSTRLTAAFAAIAMTLGTSASGLADDKQPAAELQLSTPTGFATGVPLPEEKAARLFLMTDMLPVAKGTEMAFFLDMRTRRPVPVEKGTAYLLRNDETGHWAFLSRNKQKHTFTITQQGYDSESWLNYYDARMVADKKPMKTGACKITEEFRKSNIMVFEGLTATGSLVNIWTPERITSKSVSEPGSWLKLERVTGDNPVCKRRSGTNFRIATPSYLRPEQPSALKI